jgi:hypothetical protein
LLYWYKSNSTDAAQQVEDLLSAEPWAAEQLSAARALLSPEVLLNKKNAVSLYC